MATVSAIRDTPARSKTDWATPFKIFGTDLPPNLLLMAKLLVLTFFLQRQLPLSNHFLPFVPWLDRLGSPGMFRGALLAIFAAASLLLFLNIRVRLASLTLGLVIFLSILASRPTFSNNLAYC